MSIWEVEAVEYGDNGEEHLSRLLAEGWEPFAVTLEERQQWDGARLEGSWTERVYHLRRQKIREIKCLRWQASWTACGKATFTQKQSTLTSKTEEVTCPRCRARHPEVFKGEK